MSSTWATRLAAAGDGHNLRLYVTIQGIANVFQEDATDLPSTVEAISRPRTKLITSIEQSETRLNLATRRIEGGSLTIRLQDDDAGTLAALFAPRSRRKTYIAANHTTGATTITVASNTWATGAQIFYVGGETIVAGAKSGTTLFTGCTRGAFNSEAQTHNGDSTQGEFVFNVPPSWAGRRVYLTGYFVNDDGTTTSALTQALGTFMLSAAPKHLGDDQWELACVDLVEEFGNKKIGGGLFDVQLPQGTKVNLSANNNSKVQVGAGANFNQFAVGNEPTFVRFTIDGDTYFASLIGQVSTDSIEFERIAAIGYDISNLRHIAIMTSDPGTIAQKIIASRVGDTTNGSNDVLPGLDQSNFGGDEWRMGAGISFSDLDGTSFANAAKSASLPWSYVIDDEIALSDFLFEFCLITSSAWGVSRAGKLTIYPMVYDGSTSTVTVTTSMIADDQPLTMQYAEDEIYPRVRMECNYDLGTQQYKETIAIYDVQLQRRYPHREARLDLRSRGLVVDTGYNGAGRPAITLEAAHSALRQVQAGTGRGRAYLSGVFHLPILAAEIGSIVTLSAVPIVDLEGNTSITSRLARIVSMRPRYDDAVVDVTLDLIDQLYRIAPAAIISTLVGSDLILQTTGPETASAAPARMFPAGCAIEAWDVSAGVVVAHTITAIVNDNRVTLDSALGFTLDPGVDFIRLASMTLGTTTTSDDGYSSFDFLYQMPADETSVAPDTPTRWE